MKTWILAVQTWREGIRDKILWGGLLASIVLIFIGLLASKIPRSNQGRLLLDFGLSAMEVTLAVTAVLLGATSFAKDLERRTLFLLLSKPISRTEFYAGRFLGFAILLLCMTAVASLVQVLVLTAFLGTIPPGWGISVFALWMESVLVCGFGLLFSVYSSRALALTQAIGFILVAQNMEQIHFLVLKMEDGFEKVLLTAVTKVLPDFSFFHYASKVLYQIPIDALEVGAFTLYFVVWYLILLLIGSKLFMAKNI